MKFTVEKGKLTIDLQEFVSALDKDQRKQLARYLVADETLFAAVLECVASESRLGSFFTDDDDGEWWFGSGKLLEFREKLLPLMPPIARGAVEEALRQRNDAQQKAERFRTWAWSLFHAWPRDAPTFSQPPLPDWARAPEPTKEEVDKLLEGVGET